MVVEARALQSHKTLIAWRNSNKRTSRVYKQAGVHHVPARTYVCVCLYHHYCRKGAVAVTPFLTFDTLSGES